MGVCSDLVQTAIPVQTKVAIETVSPLRLASHVLLSRVISYFSLARGAASPCPILARGYVVCLRRQMILP